MDTKQIIKQFCDKCWRCSDCDWAGDVSAKDRCDMVKTHLGWVTAVKIGVV